MSNRRQAGKAEFHADPDIGLLLDEIEKEAVPERLLRLAEELQAALAARKAVSSDRSK